MTDTIDTGLSGGQSELLPLAHFVEEFIAWRQAGRIEGVEDYVALHPEQAEALRRILPTVELMEGLLPRRAPQPEARPAGESTSQRTAGETFGEYRIVRELGRGGMGVVYEAVHLPLKRRVALKVLKDRRITNSAELARFQREAGLASRLDHPNICTVYETGEHQGEPFIAMRLLEGETLAERIAKARAADSNGVVQLGSGSSGGGSDATPRRANAGSTPRSRLPRSELVGLLRLLESVARALHAAHQKGIVHRDVKPANIMVSQGGEPVVMDFGLARDVESEEQTLTRTGEIFGTPAYMAPEQILGRREEIDQQSDVFSLGVTIYECLTLRRPFEASTREGLYRQILMEEPSDIRRIAPTLPADLSVVLGAALEKRRSHRYASALALAEDLRALSEHRPISVRPISAVGRAWRWARRKPAQAVLAVVLALGLPALAGALGFVYANLDEVRAAERQARSERLEAVLEQGFLALGEEQNGHAGSVFESALALGPEDPAALAGLALARLRSGEARAATQLLEQRPALLAAVAPLREILAEAREAVGEPAAEEPVPEAESAAALDPLLEFLEAARLRRGAALSDAATYRIALEHARAAVEAAPHARALYHFQWAMAASDADDEEESRRAARAIESLWPDSARAWFCIGFALDEIDAEAGAAADERALAIDPGLGESHQSLAHYYLQVHEHGRALEHALRAVELKPRDGLLRNTLGVAYFGLGRYAEAGAAFAAALELNPDYAGAASNLALTRWLGERDGAGARAILEQAIAREPTNAMLHIDLADLYSGLALHAEALAEVERAAELEPSHPFVLARLGQYQLKAGRCEQAVESLQRALAARQRWALPGRETIFDFSVGAVSRGGVVQDETSIRSDLALALDCAGRSAEAESEAERVLEQDPGSGFHYVSKGVLALDRGDFSGAEEAFRAALAVEPGNGAAHAQLAGVLVQTQRSAEALEHYRVALEQRSDYGALWMNYAVALHFTGAYEEAVEAYARARELGPATAQLWNNEGLALHELGRYEEARAAFEEALRLQPNHAEAHDNLGLALHKLGRLEESLAEQRRAVELDPRQGNAQAHLRERLIEAGRWEEAKAACEARTRSAEAQADAWRALAQLLLEPGLPQALADPLQLVEAGQKVLELAGETDASAWSLYARAQHVVGDVEPALESLERALALLADDAQQKRAELEALRESWRAELDR